MAADRFDLFGIPVDPGQGLRGRPRHRPTPETRAAVARLRSEGLNHVQIAVAIGITGPTLRLNYADELQSTSETSLRRLSRDQ